jgi:sec-independent protein translocase protein TatB
MFGIGMTELLVIFVIGLLVLGPKRLPELARSLGRTLAEFRRASTDLRKELLDVKEDVRIEPPSFEPPADEPLPEEKREEKPESAPDEKPTEPSGG